MISFTKWTALIFRFVTISSIIASCSMVSPNPTLQSTVASSSETDHPPPSPTNSPLSLTPTQSAMLAITPAALPTLTPRATRSRVSISPYQRLGNGELQQIKWSPDGQTIIVSTSIGIFVLDSSDLSINNQFEPGRRVHGFAVHPSGQMISTGAGDENLEDIILWDIQDGILTDTLHGNPGEVVTAVDFNSDGSMLVSGTNNGKLFLWSIADRRLIKVIIVPPVSGERFISHVLFSRDSSRIIAVVNGSIRLFDIETRQLQLSIEGDFRYIESLDISPDDRRIAVAGNLVYSDELMLDQSGTIVYDAASGQSIFRGEVVTQGTINFVLFSPDNQSLIVGSCLHYSRITERCVQGLLQRRDSQDGSNPQVLREYTSSPSSGSYSPDGMLFAVITWDIVPVIEVWDMNSNQMINSSEWYVGPTSPVVFTHDSQMVISGDPDGIIRFWDVETGTVVSTLGTQGEMVTNLALSPDGKRLASSCLSGEIKLWDLSAGLVSQTIQAIEGYENGELEFSPDGQWLIWEGSDLRILGFTVQIYHLGKNALVHTIDINHPVFDIAISPDSSMLAIGEFTDREDNIRVIEIATGYLLWSYMAPDYITSVAFSSDGAVLAAGCYNRTVLFWEVESREFIRQVSAMNRDYPFGGSVNIAFFPNDPILISTVGWSLTLWDVTTYQTLLTIERRWYSGDVIAISPNSQIIAIDPGNGTTLLWRVYGIGG